MLEYSWQFLVLFFLRVLFICCYWLVLCRRSIIYQFDESMSVSILNVFVRVSIIKWDSVIFYDARLYFRFMKSVIVFRLFIEFKYYVGNLHTCKSNPERLKICTCNQSNRTPVAGKTAHSAHCPGGWWTSENFECVGILL